MAEVSNNTEEQRPEERKEESGRQRVPSPAETVQKEDWVTGWTAAKPAAPTPPEAQSGEAEATTDLADLFGDGDPSVPRTELSSEAGGGIAPRARVTNNLPPRTTPPPPPVTRDDAARRQREAQLRYYEQVPADRDDLDEVKAELIRAGVVSALDEGQENTAAAVSTRERDELFEVYLGKVRDALQGKNIRFELTTDDEVEARQRGILSDIVRSVVVDDWSGGVKDDRWFEDLVGDLYDEMIGLGPIAPLWRDETITEIMVNSWDDVWVEVAGRLSPTRVRFRSEAHAIDVAKRLAEVVSDRALTQTTPLVTAVLPNSRVAIGFGSIVGETLAIAIRKFAAILQIDKLIEFGALTPEMADFLSDAVKGRTNIIVSGGTGSGKTTLINNLSSFIPHNERVITIEDAYELDLQHPHVVRFQTKEKASADDEVSITTSNLLRHSLRMRPDRIIVGEVRDGDAAVTLLEAANTGHDGTMTTVHANSAEAACTRLVDLFRRSSGAPSDVAAAEVASAFEMVVHVARRSLGDETRRFVTEIAEISGYNQDSGTLELRPLFEGQFARGEDGRGDTEFRRVGGLESQGRIADKMTQVGIDPRRWANSSGA